MTSDGTAAAGNQSGAFLDYRLSLVAEGLAPATWDPIWGTYWSSSEPLALSGSLSGLFENTSEGGAGFYTFDFTLTLDNWAYDTFADTEYYRTSLFAAPNAVPEPATYGIGAIALLAGLVIRRRLHLKRG